MAASEELVSKAEGMARLIRPAAEIERARRIERAIDASGNPVLDDLHALSLRSPDGSLWRIRVDNAGVLTTRKVTA